MEGIKHITKTNHDKLQMVNHRLSQQDEKIEEAERYGRRWNLKHFNLPESTNESVEDLRNQVFQIFGQMAPDEKSKLGFLVDTIHRVGRPREDRSPRPLSASPAIFPPQVFVVDWWAETHTCDSSSSTKVAYKNSARTARGRQSVFVAVTFLSSEVPFVTLQFLRPPSESITSPLDPRLPPTSSGSSRCSGSRYPRCCSDLLAPLTSNPDICHQQQS
ncbi:uncharacterized protein LOC118557136 [Fundulus heteroclitus]|uniref:uncharacterized protein LOC118557136 n=1 Tax=Fundulus heteroclitus TaxID=8078 RepID=UPI00165AED62|nr:uncharacterized protein LOC118557136 [Fundulus heteroclitus]